MAALIYHVVSKHFSFSDEKSRFTSHYRISGASPDVLPQGPLRLFSALTAIGLVKCLYYGKKQVRN